MNKEGQTGLTGLFLLFFVQIRILPSEGGLLVAREDCCCHALIEGKSKAGDSVSLSPALYKGKGE